MGRTRDRLDVVTQPTDLIALLNTRVLYAHQREAAAVKAVGTDGDPLILSGVFAELLSKFRDVTEADLESGTNLESGFVAARAELSRTTGDYKVVIGFTDGRQNMGDATAASVKRNIDEAISALEAK